MNKAVTIIIIIALSTIAIWQQRKLGYFSQFKIYLRNSAGRLCLQLFLLSVIYVGLLFVDPPFLKLLQSIQFPFFQNLLDFGAWLGKRGHLWLVILSGYFLFAWVKNNQGKQLAFGSFLSMLSTVNIAFILKHIFFRARPGMNDGPFSFFHIGSGSWNKNAFLAFPSGDVAIVAGASIFLFYNIKNIYVRLILLVLPLLTALSRMSLNRHWPSDVIFSIGLGFIFALFIRQYELKVGSEKFKISNTCS